MPFLTIVLVGVAALLAVAVLGLSLALSARRPVVDVPVEALRELTAGQTVVLERAVLRPAFKITVGKEAIAAALARGTGC